MSETIADVQLPALNIEVRGEVITSNAAAFMAAIREWLDGFKKDLETDEDFAQAEADVKVLAEKEKLITAAKQKALGDAEQLNELFKTLDDGSEEIRQARLNLDKQVKAKKEELRNVIITEAVAKIENGHGEKFRKQITEAMKGKRSLTSIRDAVGVVVTTANGLINANRQLLAAFHDKHDGNGMIPDRKALELTETPALLEAELQRRVEAKEAADERRRLEKEAAELRAQAAAKEQPAPEPVASPAKPEAPDPIGEPGASVSVSASDRAVELDAYLDAARAVFTPLKAAREKLTDPANIAKVEKFNDALRAAWKELTA